MGRKIFVSGQNSNSPSIAALSAVTGGRCPKSLANLPCSGEIACQRHRLLDDQFGGPVADRSAVAQITIRRRDRKAAGCLACHNIPAVVANIPRAFRMASE